VSERRRLSSDRSLATSTGLIVVKLGGSVVRSSELQSWLDAIAQGAGRIVVVPGGGALADEVRSSQSSLGFGDEAAHRMALLAMDQLAWAVAGLRPGFEVGDTEQALRDTLEQNQVAVWAPYALVSNRRDIPQSWTVTSARVPATSSSPSRGNSLPSARINLRVMALSMRPSRQCCNDRG
jgi:aspartokinase-like uncharacterized kinase